MHGFKVNPGTFAEFQRDFILQSGWPNKLIKLRCDAVYSECEILINNKIMMVNGSVNEIIAENMKCLSIGAPRCGDIIYLPDDLPI
jgi:hypothetical protein